MLGIEGYQELIINDIELLIYRYDPDDRGNAVGELSPTDETQMHVSGPTLPLPEVSSELMPSRYYITVQVLLTLDLLATGALNWSVLVEPQTGSVVRLGSLVGCIDGFVYLRDPLTKGNTAIRPTASSATLNTQRDRVELVGIASPGPAPAQQTLRGEYVRVLNVTFLNTDPPTEPQGDDFLYSVLTDNFPAVSAYYHCDRLFRMLEEMGIDVRSYFNGATFPVRVDHRVGYAAFPGAPLSTRISSTPQRREIGGKMDLTASALRSYSGTRTSAWLSVGA